MTTRLNTWVSRGPRSELSSEEPSTYSLTKLEDSLTEVIEKRVFYEQHDANLGWLHGAGFRASSGRCSEDPRQITCMTFGKGFEDPSKLILKRDGYSTAVKIGYDFYITLAAGPKAHGVIAMSPAHLLIIDEDILGKLRELDVSLANKLLKSSESLQQALQTNYSVFVELVLPNTVSVARETEADLVVNVSFGLLDGPKSSAEEVHKDLTARLDGMHPAYTNFLHHLNSII